jgi:hypothetical protein
MDKSTSRFPSLLARLRGVQCEARDPLTDDQRLYLVSRAVMKASRGHSVGIRLVAEIRAKVPALGPLLDYLADHPQEMQEMKSPFQTGPYGNAYRDVGPSPGDTIM